MTDAYLRQGRSPAEALKLARITPGRLRQADARITSRQMELLSGAAMRDLDDEGLGAFSRKLPWGSYGMLARASLTSPHLGLALERWCRHHALIAADIRLALTERDSIATLRIDELSTSRWAPDAREFHLVHVLRNIHGLACWYVDSRVALRGASFPYAAPAHADAYHHMFPGGPLEFDAAHAAIRFDARYLRLPLRRDDKALRLMLQRALPLTVLQYRRDRLLVEQVRQTLAAHPESGHSAVALAARLHTSARTLHRQLKEQGSSLQALKDEVRGAQARELLLRTAQPVKQVAQAVGFRNEKSFLRAFKEWMGETPAEFRLRAASGLSDTDDAALALR